MSTEHLSVEYGGPVEETASYGSVAISGDAAVLVDGHWTVGQSPIDGRLTNTPSSVTAHVFRHGTAGWTRASALELTDTDGTPLRGHAVAVSGGHVLIGAPDADGSRGAYMANIDVSPVHAFELTPKHPLADDGFGAAVSVSGNIALVGAPGHAAARGVVYVFERSADIWEQTGLLSPPDGRSGDLFGRALSLSGNTALVGAPAEGGSNGARQGAAYLFEREGHDWVLHERFSAPSAGAFGHAVCVSGDTALIGAPQLPGSAFVFQRAPGGWGDPVELNLGETDFGVSLSLSGGTALIGSPSSDDSRGAVHVFRQGPSGWARAATLSDAVTTPPRRLGFSVSISGDTGLVGVGTFERVEAHVISLEEVPSEATE